ncbi:DNA primase [Archaeoglobales archaeon]|nr:MAG: DNA primase [Archaeoglobales archaeon]
MKAPSDTTKYLVYAEIVAEGIVERPDVVGAIFGQTEGLLGEDLDLRELQKTGRIGRIEVKVESKGGKSYGEIKVPSSLDKIETAILAAALETIERVGPCAAKIKIQKIEDVRASKRRKIVERAKDILRGLFEEPEIESEKISNLVRQAIRIEEITEYGAEKLPAGPAVNESDAIIVVEGRADVLNLLRHGIKNVIAVEGTNIPKTIIELSKKKTVTAFLDGDRGGDLILKELLQVADIDYVARAPEGKGVEDLTQKEIVKSLRNKVPVEQIYVIKAKETKEVKEQKEKEKEKEVKIKIREDKEELEKLDKVGVLKRHKEEVEGKLIARVLDKNFELVKEIPVRDLVKALKTDNTTASSIVFDGVITQRLIDLAAKREVDYLVGVRLGSVVKVPTNVRIITFDEL